MSDRKHFPQADHLAERQRPIACDQVNVAYPKPRRYLRDCRATTPETKQGRGELVGSLQAGQPNPVVMSGFAVVIGVNFVAAAVRELDLVVGNATDALRGSRCETAGVRS